jgi:transposase
MTSAIKNSHKQRHGARSNRVFGSFTIRLPLGKAKEVPLSMSEEPALVYEGSKQARMTREQLITAMAEDRTFREVSVEASGPVKRAMAYRLLRAVRTKGNSALQDGRHGHPSKLRGEARAFLEATCRETPCTPSPTLQIALQERFNLQVSVSQINRVRAALGVSNPSRRSPQEKKREN